MIFVSLFFVVLVAHISSPTDRSRTTMADFWSSRRGCGGSVGDDDGDGTTGNSTTAIITTSTHNEEDQAAANTAHPHSVDQVSVCTGSTSSQGSLLEASSYRQWTIPIVTSPWQQQQQDQQQRNALQMIQFFTSRQPTTKTTITEEGANVPPPSALKSVSPPLRHRKRQRSSNNNQNQSSNPAMSAAGFPAFPIIPNPQITTTSASQSSNFGNHSDSQYYQQQQHANNISNSCNTSTASSSNKSYSQKQHFNTQELTPPSWIMSQSNGNTSRSTSRYSRRRNGRNRNNHDFMNANAHDDCYHSHYRSLPVPPPLWWLQHDQPDTAHFTQLLSALVLTTALAVLAGYDAKQHCLIHETNAILELTSSSQVDDSYDDAADANNANNNNAAAADQNDDDVNFTDDVAIAAAVQEAYEAAYDEAVLIEMDGCIKMFRHVLLPNLVVTFTLGCLGLYLLKKQPQKTPRDAYTGTLRLVIILIIIAAMQTYTVLSIMLMPRSNAAAAANVNSGAYDSENPYQSLGAVDLLGHVGDNANLYYLSWVSEALCLALVYQTVTATVRARRAVRTQAATAQQQSTTMNNNSATTSSSSRYALLPATSWSNTTSFVGSGGNGGAATTTTTTTGDDDVATSDAAFMVGPTGSAGIMKATTTASMTAAAAVSSSPASFDSAQQDKEHHESRNTWYQSLYKLRIRTGIWTAALISCLVVTASAQYIWRQVLWPHVNFDDGSSSFYDDNSNNDDAEFVDGQEEQQYDQASASASAATAAESWDLGFAVCQTIAINSARSGTSIAAQMCRRTLMAWLVGVLACLLSTFSIGMHLVARTYHHHYGDEVGHDAGAAVAAANSIHQQFGNHPRSRSNHNSIVTIEEHHQHVQNDTYYLHYRTTLFRQLLERHRVPLGIELVLSILLSLLLGCNAVLATGVQGPAANVGNLYYASWFAFLLLIRICLGCLEEWYEVEKKDDSLGRGGGGDSSNTPCNVNKKPSRLGVSNDGAATAVATATEIGYKAAPDGNMQHDQGVPLEKPSQDSDRSVQSMMDPSEKDRVNRLRSYFFLGIFSAVCAASSYDAGANQEASLTRIQQYFILSPLIVACQSLILFILCLSKRCYLVASHFCVGGILSVVSFVLWLCDLILTMHSDESWAVNGIGEIEMANLYYFSWASIIAAGLQLMSYLQALFGISKGEDYMTVVWLAIVKVCFVILGAAIHIWHTIADKCDLNYVMSNGAFSFCSRTIMAMIIALTGMLVGGLVVLVRIMLSLCCPKCHCSRIQAHIEMLLSSFLVFLFGAAVALITSIGSPGQSVGDLYYSTWLAFWVSLGIFVSCYDQINREEDEQDKEKEEEEEEEYNPTGEYRREVDEPRHTAVGDSVLV